MKKLGAVILNYNDSLRCIEQAKLISSYHIFDQIVIVDNNSDNDEKNIIKKHSFSTDIKVIFNNENRGYGAGNNVGLKYLASNKFDYVLLLNVDNVLSKNAILDFVKFLDEHDDIAIVTSLMIEKGKLKRNFYDFPCLKNSFFDSVTLETNLIGKDYSNLNDKEKIDITKKLGNKCHSAKYYENYLTCDFVCESATLYRLNSIKEVDYFDEEFFLYCEGPVISKKLQKINMKTAILFVSEPYFHNHKGRGFNRKKFKAIKNSQIRYFKKYLHYPAWKILPIKILWINVYIK